MDQSLGYKIAVMQAFKEGKAIEMAVLYDVGTGEFFDVKDPSWNWYQCYYRVKQSVKSWKDVVMDKLVCCCIDTKEHETNPEKAVNDLLAWEIALALDPLVSGEAAKLLQTVPAALLDKTFIVWCDEGDGLSRSKLAELLPLVNFPGNMILRMGNGAQAAMYTVAEGKFWEFRHDLTELSKRYGDQDPRIEFHFTLKRS